MSLSSPLAQPAPEPSNSARREQEILDAVREVFTEKGFDGASMQDLARAAGMSVGNFYRYFPSKAAMIEAMIRRDIAEVEERFARIASADQPLPALRRELYDRIRNHACDFKDAPLWAEMNAVSLRNPEYASIMGTVETEVIGYLVQAFALSTGLPTESMRAQFSSHAHLILLLVKLSAMQSHTAPPAEAQALTELILRQVDHLLDEVAAAQPKDSEE